MGEREDEVKQIVRRAWEQAMDSFVNEVHRRTRNRFTEWEVAEAMRDVSDDAEEEWEAWVREGEADGG